MLSAMKTRVYVCVLPEGVPLPQFVGPVHTRVQQSLTEVVIDPSVDAEEQRLQLSRSMSALLQTTADAYFERQ